MEKKITISFKISLLNMTFPSLWEGDLLPRPRFELLHPILLQKIPQISGMELWGGLFHEIIKKLENLDVTFLTQHPYTFT